MRGAVPRCFLKFTWLEGCTVRFRNRIEAGRALGKELASGAWTNPLVLALPRGGVPVAEQVALAIGAQLDVIVSRKIGAPFNPEMGIGAVGSDGNVVLDRPLIRRLKVGTEYIDNASRLELDEIARRLSAYRGARPFPMITGRDIVVVDDGIATGYTVMAAVRSLSGSRPLRLVVATPVCPPDTFQWLRQQVDMAVSLATPEDFAAVGQFYVDFAQVSDAEVIETLSRWWDREN